MSEPTTTLRFPDRLHTKAKIAATEAGLSLQELVGQAVEAYIGSAPAKKVDPALESLTRRIGNLPARCRTIAERFVGVLETAPDFYVRAIDQYITGMQALFRRVDRRHFEAAAESSRAKVKKNQS